MAGNSRYPLEENLISERRRRRSYRYYHEPLGTTAGQRSVICFALLITLLGAAVLVGYLIG